MLVGAFGLLGLANTGLSPGRLFAQLVAPRGTSSAEPGLLDPHVLGGFQAARSRLLTMLAMHGWFGWRGAFIGSVLLGRVAAALFLILSDRRAGALNRATQAGTPCRTRAGGFSSRGRS